MELGQGGVLFPSDCPWRTKMINRGFAMLAVVFCV